MTPNLSQSLPQSLRSSDPEIPRITPSLIGYFAQRLKREAGDDLEAQLTLGLEIVTTRPADPAALAVAKELTDKLQAEHGLGPEQALERFCLVALNLNEFMFVD